MCVWRYAWTPIGTAANAAADVGDAGATAIASALAAHVSVLELRLGRESFEEAAPGRHSPRARADNIFGYEGVTALAGMLRQNAALTALHMDGEARGTPCCVRPVHAPMYGAGAELTDDGVDAMVAALSVNTTLKRLSVPRASDCVPRRVTNSGIDAASRARH